MRTWKIGLMIVAFAAIATFAVPAMADWKVGDPYKMHYPQLPNPNGWDVAVWHEPTFGPMRQVADDWLCSETGPVSDIHVWLSAKGDDPTSIQTIIGIRVTIFDDDRSGSFSKPGDVLWQRFFGSDEFTIVSLAGQGEQGWFDPFYPDFQLADHNFYHQFNIENISDPFVQEVDKIYWLGISVTMVDALGGRVGWKTSLAHYEDDAVWRSMSLPQTDWQELRDPITGESLDMAFVITPEPGTIALLLLGGLALLGHRRSS